MTMRLADLLDGFADVPNAGDIAVSGLSLDSIPNPPYGQCE